MGDRRSHGILKVITACSEDDKTPGLLTKLGTCVHTTNWTIFQMLLHLVVQDPEAPSSSRRHHVPPRRDRGAGGAHAAHPHRGRPQVHRRRAHQRSECHASIG